MPRGRKKKDVEETPVVEAAIEPTLSQDAPVEPVKAPVKQALTGWDAVIAESRKLLDIPLQPGQAYFESPEGIIMVDEESRGRVWCRQADKGRGMWINPRR